MSNTLSKDALEEVKKLTPADLDRLNALCKQPWGTWWAQDGDVFVARMLPQLLAEVERYQWQAAPLSLTRTVEQMPSPGVKVLAYWDGVVLEATRLASGHWVPEVPFISHESSPSHWMPLPAPPVMQSGGSNAND